MCKLSYDDKMFLMWVKKMAVGDYISSTTIPALVIIYNHLILQNLVHVVAEKSLIFMICFVLIKVLTSCFP